MIVVVELDDCWCAGLFVCSCCCRDCSVVVVGWLVVWLMFVFVAVCCSLVACWLLLVFISCCLFLFACVYCCLWLLLLFFIVLC